MFKQLARAVIDVISVIDVIEERRAVSANANSWRIFMMTNCHLVIFVDRLIDVSTPANDCTEPPPSRQFKSRFVQLQ